MLFKEIQVSAHEIRVGSTNHCFDSCDFLRKEASAESVEYFNNLKPKKDHLYFLVVAMTAGEWWSSNRNGDYFKEEDLKKYYNIFENAGVFWNHDNGDPNKSFGKVLKSFYNDKMHRVELVIEVPTDKSRHLKDYIEEGRPISVSMGLNTPCFIAGTMVTMGDGTEKPIEDIEVGEYVKTSQGNIKRVTKTTITPHIGSLIAIKTKDGKTINGVTPQHKFHVYNTFENLDNGDIIPNDKKEWMVASSLSKATYLTSTISSENMKVIEIEEIDSYDFVGDVYDIVVEDDHTFLAEGINVHNSEICSICGHVTRGSYTNRCEHLKFMMNTVLHDGRKVYAICGTPYKLFDISFVWKPADRTAYAMLTKTASEKSQNTVGLGSVSGSKHKNN